MIGALLASAIAATIITFRNELSSKSPQTIVYDQKQSDIHDLGQRIDNYLNDGNLKNASTLINRQLEIDNQNPLPYAQLGRYYQLRSGNLEGPGRLANVEKSIDSYNIALQLADICAPGKVLPNFKPLVSKQIGIVLSMRAGCKFEARDISGAVEDCKVSLKHNLDNDLRKTTKEFLQSLQSSV